VSVDLQVAFPQEVIKITGVRRVPGTSPAVFDITGADFSAVDEVLLNEHLAKDFAVLSQTRLLVTAPDAVGNVVRSVSVTSRRLVMTEKSVLRLRLSGVPSKVSGILRLLQLFVKILFTSPTSDIFNKRLGAGALKNLGRNFGKGDAGGIISDFVVAAENTSRQIIALQGRQPALPPDERMLTAKVTTARFDAQTSALIVSVEVTSQAGRAATANLMV
jgi:hypothetical protein